MLTRRSHVAGASMLGIALVVVVASLVLIAATTTDEPVTNGKATFAILNSPASPLPAGSRTPTLRAAGVNPNSDARLAFGQGSLRMYVVAPSGGNQLCLVVRSSAATVSTCRLRSALTPDSVIWISHAKPGGVYDLYGLVPDGVTDANVAGKYAAVRKNVFLLEDAAGDAESVTLTRSGNGSRTVQIGRQVPTGVQLAPDPEP